MAVSLKYLYEDIVAELGQGVGSTKLNSAYMRAVNRALSQLENKADTGTDFALYSDINDSVSELSAKHDYILYAGVMYWLQRMGYANGDPRIAAAVLSDTERLWQSAIGDYTKDKINADQATGGIDIIGLGDLA
jgi:hypothetical protein